MRCVLFEAGSRTLTKVAISGGGRCNLTHHEFEVSRLVEHYPRGFRELRGSFSRFQPRDTIEWFRERGVKTKVEADGRMFPVSDDSQDVIRCLEGACDKVGVETRLQCRLSDLQQNTAEPGFILRFKNGEVWRAGAVVIASGSHSSGHEVAARMGHRIVTPTPSLFTFNIVDERLEDLAGLSFEKVTISVKLGKKQFSLTGPMLITHWGLSGPAILKLSAWASRELAAEHYRGCLVVDFAPDLKHGKISTELENMRQQHGSRNIENTPLSIFPKRYWQSLVDSLELGGKKISQLTKANLDTLVEQSKAACFTYSGKSTHKNEFVTAGGVDTSQVNLATFESRLVPGLYFVGEVLNIDGVTGGFNFQHAWTSAYLCAMKLNQDHSSGID